MAGRTLGSEATYETAPYKERLVANQPLFKERAITYSKVTLYMNSPYSIIRFNL